MEETPLDFAELQTHQRKDPKKLNVLLVEDDRLIRFIHTNFLEGLNCNVQSVENGEKALEALKKEDNVYDIIFMDMGLPDIMGIEIIKFYRNLEKKKKSQKTLPIIALTAYGGKNDRKDFMDAGVDEVIVKPVTVGQLSEIIKIYCT